MPAETVDLSVDSRIFTGAVADGTGAFVRRARIPAWALPGSTEIVATGESSGLTASAPFLVDTEWGQPRDTATNRGFNPFENVVGPSNVADLAVAWSQTSGFGTEVVAAHGYVVSVNEYLSVLDGVTGAVIWSVPMTLGPVATVHDGVVYAANGEEVVAYDLITGVQRWKSDSGTYAGDRLTVTDGLVLFGDSNGFLRALDASTGDSVWATRILTTSTPAVANGLVYVESLGVGSFAVEEQTGQVVWTAPTGYQFMSPTVGHGAVFESSGAGGDDHLVAFDALTGDIVWQSTDTIGGSSSSPAYVAPTGTVYATSSGSIYALDANTGDTVWVAPTGDAIYGSPAVANGVVYVTSTDGFLYAFHAATGALLGTWNLGGWPAGYNSPIVVNGFVYVGSAYSGLVALSIP
jgi:outer membrane protein assembly factor BamB